MTAALVLLLLGSAAFVTGLALRGSAYRRFFRYQPDEDQHYDFTNSDAVIAELRVGADGFTWPQVEGTWDTAFLEVSVQPTWIGRFAEPSIEVRTRHHWIRQYLERGSAGRRLLNLSPLLEGGVTPGQRFWIHGFRADWRAQDTRLVLFKTSLSPRARALILAPHPDDAEIAAFGFYSQADATVVTVTAGEGGGFYTAHAQAGDESVIGHMRVWDSIHVPALGGVTMERAVNLGYADGTLAEMHDQLAASAPAAAAFRTFRRANASPLLTENAEPSWASLVQDLTEIARRSNPEVIVTPHPLIDDHPDHAFTTLAICDVLHASSLREGKLFLYTNHPPTTNLYPLGGNDGVVSLPPRFGEALDFRAIRSHSLSPASQRMKFLALESMHDLRTLPRLERQGWSGWFHDTLAGLRNQITGLDARATSYFRRAVRGNELFFVCEFSDAGNLAERLRTALREGKMSWHTFQ